MIEDAEDRFVLIPPQEMDCNYGIHKVADEEEEEQEPDGCQCTRCMIDRKKQVADEKDDSFEMADRIQEFLEILVESRRRAHEAQA